GCFGGYAKLIGGRAWNIDSAGEILCHGLPSERPHLRECEERVTWQPSFAECCDCGAHRASLLNEAAGLLRRPFAIKHQGCRLNRGKLEIRVPCHGSHPSGFEHSNRVRTTVTCRIEVVQRPLWVTTGHSAISAQCPVCAKADTAGQFMSTRPRHILIRSPR